MQRREFLSWVGVGSLASFLPVVIAACKPEEKPQATAQPPAPPTQNTATATNKDGYLAVGTVSELDKSSQILNKEIAGGPVLIIRNPQDTKNVIAVNPTCPHKGCLVKWEVEDKYFECPCHDSDFAIDGQVLKGPATQALKIYPVKIENNSILVKTT